MGKVCKQDGLFDVTDAEAKVFAKLSDVDYGTMVQLILRQMGKARRLGASFAKSELKVG